MQHKIYIQYLVTEAVIFEAESQQEALRLAAEHGLGSGIPSILRFASVDPKGFVRQIPFQSFDWPSIRRSVPFEGSEEECIAHQFRLQLMKSLALTERIADFYTTRDLAVERNETDDEVLLTRDLIDEYDTFMLVIRTARAALDLPDHKYAPVDDSSSKDEGGGDDDDCDENYVSHGGPRLDGQYPAKFYESVPDEAASIAEPEI